MIKLIVTAVRYTRYGDPYKDIVKVYEGDNSLELFRQIAQAHGYPPDDEHTRASQVLEKLTEENGDGCDYILSIIDGKGNILFDGTTH